MKDYIISLVQHYGAIGVAIGLMFEFIGFPIPGETMMTFLGFLTYKGINESFLVAIICCIVGSNIGSMFAYFVGRKYGEDVLLKYGKYVFITKEKLDKTERLINKNKVILLLFNQFILGVRHVIPYLSGISKINFRNFITYNLIGTSIWCVTFLSIGAILGDNWEMVEILAKKYSLIFLLFIILIFVIFIFIKKRKKSC